MMTPGYSTAAKILEDSGNQYLYLEGPSYWSNRGCNRAIPEIEKTNTATTLFFRVYAETAGPDLDGTTPDITLGGESWQASSTVDADGAMGSMFEDLGIGICKL